MRAAISALVPPATSTRPPSTRDRRAARLCRPRRHAASLRLRVRERATLPALRDRRRHSPPDGHTTSTNGIELLVDEA